MTDTNPRLASFADSVSRSVQDALEAAYAAGVRDGTKAALDSIVRAVGQVGGTEAVEGRAAEKPEVLPKSKPAVHWNSSEVRPFRYGAVAAAFRKAISRAPPWGYSKNELIASAAKELQAPPSSIKYRDTFKRLRESNEMLFENGRYRPGPHLIGASRAGNGETDG